MSFWSQFLSDYPQIQSLADGEGVVVTLDKEGAAIQIAVDAPVSEETGRRWEKSMTEALGFPVRLLLGQVPADAAEPLLKMAQAALRRWAAPEDVRLLDGELGVCFSSPASYELFTSAGGPSWLRRTYPTLPPVRVEVRPEEPLPPDETVVMPEPGDPPVRVGRGRPSGRPVRIAELPEAGAVIAAGRLFQVARRATQRGGEILLAGLDDGTGSLRIKILPRGREPVDGRIVSGLFVRVRGTLEQDVAGETVLRVQDLGEDEAHDALAPDAQPRVEWHAHSKMSAMDGLNDLEGLFRLARDLGHPAVAVTDHGVLQSYPEAARLGARYGVRPIYGLEANVVPDAVRAFSGPPPRVPPLEAAVVAVDLETTGLSPRAHGIVEVGAVRLERGEIVGQFHRMVRAERPLSRDSRAITQIGEADLAAAEEPTDVWAAFQRFAAGAILVAHNAVFDRGFLVPVIGDGWAYGDTLQLGRALVQDVKGYGLEPLCAYFHIPLVEHHRALNDAEAAGRLWLALWGTPAGRALQEREDWWQAPLAVGVRVQRPVPVLVYPRRQDSVRLLYEMVSASHLETFWRVPRIRWSTITASRDAFLVGAPAIGGELSELWFRNAGAEEWREALGRYDFVEVVPPAALADWEQDGYLSSRDAVERLLLDLDARAREAGVPVVASSDTHYRRPQDKVFRDVLQATAKGDVHAGRGELFYRTTGELVQELAFFGSDRAEELVVANSLALLAAIDEDIKPVPDGLHAPQLEDAEQVVSERPFEVARKLFGTPLPPLVESRLRHEVDAIVRHGFASVYYTAHRLVEKSLQDGYLVGSRGSVGSSLVATYLDITEVNPLPPHYRCPACHHAEFFTGGEVGSGFDLPPKACPSCQAVLIGDGQDIPFETFLGFEGDKVPDIDLNFSGEYQSTIHRYTEELFGSGQVYRAGTIATIADRTAFGLVKAWARETGRTLAPVEVDRLSEGLLGVKRTTGQHPGGLMVVPAGEDIHRFTPVQRPADALDAEVVTTHFDYHAIEGRLLKLDLLGHEDPTTLRMLFDLTGIDPRTVPFHDAETIGLFSGLRTLGLTEGELDAPVGSLGLPEFGTPFVRRMLADTRPTSFAELVRISGLSHGTNVWASNAEELVRKKVASLSEVIATRDDIMTSLIRMGLEPQAAFAISERVRRGRGLEPEQEALMRDHGVPGWYIDSCRRITYLFPKAHAAAYVMMGWRIAWFKVHRPLAFYAVYCTVHGDDFVPDAALGGLESLRAESRRIEALGLEATPKERGQLGYFEVLREMALRGFGFKPVSLMLSDAARFMPTGERDLLVPFAALPGVGRQAAENIVLAREEGPFLSVDDLRQRCRLSRTVLDLLRQAGALDGLGETRQLGLF